MVENCQKWSKLVEKCQKCKKIVKNYQTMYFYTYKSTYMSSRLYFEPSKALLLDTYPIIHPQDLEINIQHFRKIQEAFRKIIIYRVTQGLEVKSHTV